MQPPGPTAIDRGVARAAAVLAVPLLLLAVVGLWLGRAPAGVVTAPPAASPAAVPTPVADQTYLDAAHAHGVTGPDVAVVSTARNACAALNAGGNDAHVAHYVAVRHDLADGDARIVLRAAVHAYCPAHEGEIAAT